MGGAGGPAGGSGGNAGTEAVTAGGGDAAGTTLGGSGTAISVPSAVTEGSAGAAVLADVGSGDDVCG